MYPVKVPASGGGYFTGAITASASKESHSLILKSDGTVWAWGLNKLDEFTGSLLGINSNAEYQYTPEIVTFPEGSPSSFVSISASFYYSLAVGSDGSVWSWGMNEYCQLGRSECENMNWGEVYYPSSVTLLRPFYFYEITFCK